MIGKNGFTITVQVFCLSMIFSENRFPLFGIMLYFAATTMISTL